MKIIPISSIFVPENRQRKTFSQEQLNELAESIRSHGLYHPIVVAPDGDKYRLVAGERRLRAIKQLADIDIGFKCGSEQCPPGYAPCNLITDLDEIQLREVELEENVIRVDLTWQERVRAIAELDALRREQSTTHTTADTAREIYGYGSGQAVESVRTAIALAKHLDDPEISAAKSQKEARRILERKLKAQHLEKLAAEFDDSSSPHKVIHGDAREIMPTLPAESFQCIIADPPYGVRADTFGDQPALKHEYDDTREYSDECYELLATEGYRAAAREAHIYVFCDISQFYRLSKVFESVGWRVWPRPILWWKGVNMGMLPRPEHGPRYTYEAILFASKGDKKVLRVAADVIQAYVVLDKDHAAEKPVSLYVDLLTRSCLPGDSVLDPFAGSGTIFPAANIAKVVATGIEISGECVALCKARAGEWT